MYYAVILIVIITLK